MLTEQDRHVLTLLAAFNAEAQPEQRRRILHTLRPQLPGNGERQRILRRCLLLLVRNEKLRNGAQGEIV